MSGARRSDSPPGEHESPRVRRRACVSARPRERRPRFREGCQASPVATSTPPEIRATRASLRPARPAACKRRTSATPTTQARRRLPEQPPSGLAGACDFAAEGRVRGDEHLAVRVRPADRRVARRCGSAIRRCPFRVSWLPQMIPAIASRNDSRARVSSDSAAFSPSDSRPAISRTDSPSMYFHSSASP